MLKRETIDGAIQGSEDLKKIYHVFKEMVNFHFTIRGQKKPNKINHLFYTKYGQPEFEGTFSARVEFNGQVPDGFNDIISFTPDVLMMETEDWQRFLVKEYIQDVCMLANVPSPFDNVYYILDDNAEMQYSFGAIDDDDATGQAVTWIAIESDTPEGTLYGLWRKPYTGPDMDCDVLVDTFIKATE